MSFTYDNNNALTPEEKLVLSHLTEAFYHFVELGEKVDFDEKEFSEGIHKCQTLVGLRVARRIDPLIWRTE